MSFLHNLSLALRCPTGLQRGLATVVLIPLLASAVTSAETRPNVSIRAADGRRHVSPIDPRGVHWHQWRGPEANGVSRTAKPPVEWSEEKNIKWKVAIDGKGNASPIVWGDKVFVLTATNTGRVDPSRPKPEDQPRRVFGIKHPNTFYKFDVLCLDRATGKTIWRRTATERVPHEGTHNDADFASASPTTDGERLYCWFGSAGLYCYDLDGAKLWERELGKAYVGASLGEGCSPVVHKGRVVIVRDHARQSTIEVLDAKTGETRWKKERDEPNAWATPRVVDHGGRTQVITAASNLIRSYDLDTGNLFWQCSGLTGNVTPCPVVEGDFVYCMSGYKGYALLALRLDARGDISESDKIVWAKGRGTPYVPSPILYDGLLYFTQSNQGILSAVDAKTGDSMIQRTRLPGVSNLYSSPVGADGRIYFTDRNGSTLVVKRSDKLEVLATNRLDDEFNTSPALCGKQLLLRGRKSLYCIETAGGDASSNPSSNDDSATTKNPSLEKRTRVHRLNTTKRSVYDAFSYLNRLPNKPYEEEFPVIVSRDVFSVAWRTKRAGSGLVVKDEQRAIHVLPNPLRPKEIHVLAKTDIDERRKPDVSTMPEGLLDTYTREEILDLLEFVQSGGKPSSGFRQ